MKATAFIVHWNSPESCLDLCRAFASHDWIREVVIIDNGSAAADVCSLKSAPGRARVLALQQNLGWGPALNVGLRHWMRTDDEFCIISAHDAVPQGNALDMLAKALAEDEKLGFVCPEYGTEEVPHYDRLRATRMKPSHRQPDGTVLRVDFCNATLLGARKECLSEIGLFDERMFAYGDEVEICLRARRLGWKVGLCWGSIVANPCTTTNSYLRTYLFTRNMLLLSSDYAGFFCTTLRAVWMPVKGSIQVVIGGSLGGAVLSGWWDWFRGRNGRPCGRVFAKNGG